MILTLAAMCTLAGAPSPLQAQVQVLDEICMGTSIPSGKVIVSQGRSTSCAYYSSSTYNMWRVSNPYEEARICAGSYAIPNGWVIYEKVSDSDCPYYDLRMPNAYKIKTPQQGQLVCATPNTTPTGWMITQVVPSSPEGCKSFPEDVSGRYAINIASEGLRFCTGRSRIPAGWTSHSPEAVSQCGGSDPRLPNSRILQKIQ